MKNSEIIIIVGHGNPDNIGDNTSFIADELHIMIHPSCNNNCVKVAYLQFMKPNLEKAITSAVKDGAKKIIIHPFLLSSGYHVSKNIPDIINSSKNNHLDVEFVYTEPLGAHKKLVEIVLERIRASTEIEDE